ncbi:hypothetical protein PBV87_08045 [Niameybacter massiliensis]|uniref:Uncharacterized protein n=1 Tax=Holtiella tumoricola TaxID=3018743 RepID=A0AA42DME3_9FIRM|nr:hypothetical protein [Holtiella tumoricola]MDA3731426.1 hypothetical protein [Holtiella tumoricola]
MINTKDSEIYLYTVSNLLMIIEEFNQIYRNVEYDELREIANYRFKELDLSVRISYPFRNMASFDCKTEKNREVDIVVRDKGLEIEVKYLRNYNSKAGTSNSANWKNTFEKDYSWICNKIKSGEKGKSAFIIGWFNAYERFSQIVQLGTGKSSRPLINKERMKIFPFVNVQENGTRVDEVFYMYNKAYQPLNINIDGCDSSCVDCVFLGKPEDKFHFAIYY